MTTTTSGTAGWQPDYVKQHLAEQTRYLDVVAGDEGVRRVAANAMALLDLKAGQSVLEMGCGSGVFLPRLAAAVGTTGRVVGLDHAQSFVAEATRKMAVEGFGNIEIIQGNAYKLPFEQAAFDAAHCERVLMHLEDPTAALAEMARVVKPGGVVVAAEPDWAGFRFDHPDREAFERVYAASVPHRHADMGITLGRRMTDVGLRDLKYSPAVFCFDNLDGVLRYGLNLQIGVDKLLAEKAMSAERLNAVIRTMERENAAGRYFVAGMGHVVYGRVG